MRTHRLNTLRVSRLRPLAACLAIAFSADILASPIIGVQAIAQIDPAGEPRTAHTERWAGAGLQSSLRNSEATAPDHPSTTLIVKNCNDSGAESLREAIGAAPDNAAIEFDLAQTPCSTITLTTGEIKISVDNLTIEGPGSDLLTIDGGYATSFQQNRIFHHTGQGQLAIKGLQLTDAKYEKNTVQALGGCVASNGKVLLDHAMISECKVVGMGVPAFGGAINARGVTLISSTIENCSTVSDVSSGGGGLTADAYGIAVAYSTLSNNAAISTNPQNPSSNGGGIFSRGPTHIYSSTISGNQAVFGGGMSVRALTLVNSTISTNVASRYIGGVDADGAVEVSDSTISFNRDVGRAGGMHGTSIQANGSIFAYNTSDDGNGPIEADVTSGDGVVGGAHNLIMATAGMTIPPMNTLTDCPRLAPLMNNGGPTKTHALLPGGPAINAGSSFDSQSFDQRGPGFARVIGSAEDIGAYEWSAGSGDTINSDGFDACN